MMHSAVTELRLRRLRRKLERAHEMLFGTPEKEPEPEERLERYLRQRDLQRWVGGEV